MAPNINAQLLKVKLCSQPMHLKQDIRLKNKSGRFLSISKQLDLVKRHQYDKVLEKMVWSYHPKEEVVSKVKQDISPKD